MARVTAIESFTCKAQDCEEVAIWKLCGREAPGKSEQFLGAYCRKHINEFYEAQKKREGI